MGRRYKQLSLEERCDIARLQAEGHSIRSLQIWIARHRRSLGRWRNRGRRRYKPGYAEEQAKARRWQGRVLPAAGVAPLVLDRLARASPEQVAERLNREIGYRVISYESIYRPVHLRPDCSPRTGAGAIICHAARAGAASAGDVGRQRCTLHRTCFHSRDLPKPQTARPLATGSRLSVRQHGQAVLTVQGCSP